MMKVYRKPAKPPAYKRRDLKRLDKPIMLANGRKTRWVKNIEEKENVNNERIDTIQ